MTQLRTGSYAALLLSILLVVTGCLELEGISVSLDFNQNICTATYYGLGSNEKEKAKIEEDFQSLIQDLNDCRTDKSGSCLSAELYPEGNKLDGKIVFRFNESFLTADSLREYQLQVDETKYFISLPDSDEGVVKGNGEIIQEGSKKIMKWSKATKLIQYEMRKSAGFKDEKKITNLLPRWRNWISQKQTGGANIVKPEKETVK
jgi:hypothetical protein